MNIALDFTADSLSRVRYRYTAEDSSTIPPKNEKPPVYRRTVNCIVCTSPLRLHPPKTETQNRWLTTSQNHPSTTRASPQQIGRLRSHRIGFLVHIRRTHARTHERFLRPTLQHSYMNEMLALREGPTHSIFLLLQNWFRDCFQGKKGRPPKQANAAPRSRSDDSRKHQISLNDSRSGRRGAAAAVTEPVQAAQYARRLDFSLTTNWSIP